MTAIDDPDRTALRWEDATRAAPAWRVLLARLELALRFDSFADALAFVGEVGAVAEAHDHHPDIDLRYQRVLLRLSSHDVGDITPRDVRLANAIAELAERFGAERENDRLTTVEIGIDALDIEAIRPFWRAVLGYRDAGVEPADRALADRDARGPGVWFQQMDAPRPQRNRVHLDVTVPHDEAEARVAAALAAGGRLVSDRRAPSFWVLADAEGNEACVCTWQARD